VRECYPFTGVVFRRRRRRARRRFVAATERFRSPHSAAYLLLSSHFSPTHPRLFVPRRAVPRPYRTVWEDRGTHRRTSIPLLDIWRAHAVHAWRRTATADTRVTRCDRRVQCVRNVTRVRFSLPPRVPPMLIVNLIIAVRSYPFLGGGCSVVTR
jgi:hypothetical protein